MGTGPFGSDSSESQNFEKVVRISTVHSFKGWELPNIIILTESLKAFDKRSYYLMYTALTRTLSSITVLNRNNNYKEFSEYFNSFK